jgi:NodT family efflux transporter outer membrane factor (OMF) lipoprotein
MNFPGKCRLAHLIFLGLTLIFSSCAKVGPNFAPPAAQLSSNWLEASDQRVKTEPANYRTWWEVFNDEALNRVIDVAYRQNLSLKIAAVRVLEARALLGIATGKLYPQTQQANGAATYNRISSFGVAAAAAPSAIPASLQSSGLSVSPSLQNNFWTDQYGLNASWEIDFWGKFRRAVESADATLRANLADYDSALVSLTADAATSYMQIRTLQKRLEIARQNVETQKASLELAQARFEGGATSERDVEQAKTILFNTQAAIPVLEAQLRQATNALSVLLGMPPDNLEEVLGGPSGIPTPPFEVAVGIPAELIRRRPDVRSAEFQAAAQSAKIGVAKADLFPAFSLIGTFGFSASDIGASKLSDIGSLNARVATAGPSFQWNILNYGQITNNVRVQDARFQELLLTYQNTVLTAQREVEDSLTGFLRSQENADYLGKSAEAAQKSLDLASVQYRYGSTDFTTVLTAQQALLTAQDSLASALGSISTNLVGLYRAMGGGWQIREGHDILSPEVKEAMSRRTNWGCLLTPAAYIPPPRECPDIRPPDW